MDKLNTSQKIFIIIGITSILLLLISVIGFEWDFSQAYVRYDMKGAPTDWGKDYGLEYFFKRNDHGVDDELNFFGIISLIAMTISASGFFLFKDK